MAKRNVVLVVDDDVVARTMVVALLRAAGLDVLEAGDGTTALKLAVERRPNLILLDLGLPGMDGFDVCARIRARDEIGETPILVMTG
ncbi:MAG TPA: response regulator, partial [Gemmatimonadaceae bacterium]|nr:response regulator [Gemmatimonadaceae bacterium]